MNTGKTLDQTVSRGFSAWLLPVVIGALGVGLALIVGLYLYGTSIKIPLDRLTTDVNSFSRAPIHYGVLADLGTMLWAGAAICALLGAALIRVQQPANRRRFRFLLASGLFGLVLCLDDLLNVHDYIMPVYLHIPERIPYMAYLLMILAYLLVFVKEIAVETDYPVLVLALSFFAFSIILPDLYPFQNMHRAMFYKDSLKFLGILFWQVYFFLTVVRFARPADG